MWRSFDGCANRSLSSFLLSFCYDIVLDGIRSFNSQVDQRIEEALCLSLCSYTGCLFFQEKLHIRRRSSRLSCKFPRSLPTPKSITAKMWCRTHSGSATILICRLPLIIFYLFPLVSSTMNRSQANFFMYFFLFLGVRGSDHPDLYIFIASWNQFKAHPNSCCFQGPPSTRH
jgi:hypothetical protein